MAGRIDSWWSAAFTFYVSRFTRHATRNTFQISPPQPCLTIARIPPFSRLDPEHRNCQTFLMTTFSLAIVGLVSTACIGAAAEDYTIRAFKRIQLSDLFRSEGANFDD